MSTQAPKPDVVPNPDEDVDDLDGKNSPLFLPQVLRRMAISFATGRHLETNLFVSSSRQMSDRLLSPVSSINHFFATWERDTGLRLFSCPGRDPPVPSRVLHFLKNL